MSVSGGTARGGSPAFLMRKDETPGAVLVFSNQQAEGDFCALFEESGTGRRTLEFKQYINKVQNK